VALARTDLLGVIDPTPSGVHGTTDYTSSSFTPPSSSLLVVGAGYIEVGTTTDPTSAVAISGGSLTWTQGIAVVVDPTSYPLLVKIWTAPVITGASMALTLSAGGRNVGFYAPSVVAYTGYDTSTPVGATGSASDATLYGGASPVTGSITLSGAPAAASEVFAVAAISRDTAGTSPGSGWTEVHDVNQGTYGGMQSQVRTGSTSTSVAWADLRAGGGNYFKYVGAAIEIKAAPVPSWTYGYDVRIG
jgi:hypothetical protein